MIKMLKNCFDPIYQYNFYKTLNVLAQINIFAENFNKLVAPNKGMLGGKKSLELINVQHFY